MSLSKITVVVPGLTFHFPYADGQPLFRVIKPRGAGVWDCAIDDSDPDYAGKPLVFEDEEILDRVNSKEYYSQVISSSETWWQAQPVGSIVHYHNGFKEYVRCRVVEVGGAKCVVPIALVGEWSAHDLPKVTPWGQVREGYYSRNIRNQEHFKPNYTTIFEASARKQAAGVPDPRCMPEIDLTIPAITEDQKRAATLDALRGDLVTLLSVRPPNGIDFADRLHEMLVEAKKKLNDAIVE